MFDVSTEKMYIRCSANKISRTRHGRWRNRPGTEITDSDSEVTVSEENEKRDAGVKRLWLLHLVRA